MERCVARAVPMKVDPEEVRASFEKLPEDPSDEELRRFIDDHFLPAGVDLHHAEPVDFPGDARRWFAYAEPATPLARARPLGVEAAPLLTTDV